MNDKDIYSNIRLTKDTKNMLDGLGEYRDSYDKIIRRLINTAKDQGKTSKQSQHDNH